MQNYLSDTKSLDKHFRIVLEPFYVCSMFVFSNYALYLQSQGTSRKRHIGSKPIEWDDVSSKRHGRQQSELRNEPTQFLENVFNELIERRSKADNTPSKSAIGSSQDAILVEEDTRQIVS